MIFVKIFVNKYAKKNKNSEYTKNRKRSNGIIENYEVGKMRIFVKTERKLKI